MLVTSRVESVDLSDVKDLSPTELDGFLIANRSAASLRPAKAQEGDPHEGIFRTLMEIDLSSRTVEYTGIPDDVLASALAPENVFVIATGPTTGTSMWGQNRYAVFSTSPATGGYGESYCGGSLAPKIKGCGAEALRGRETPGRPSRRCSGR